MVFFITLLVDSTSFYNFLIIFVFGTNHLTLVPPSTLGAVNYIKCEYEGIDSGWKSKWISSEFFMWIFRLRLLIVLVFTLARPYLDKYKCCRRAAPYTATLALACCCVTLELLSGHAARVLKLSLTLTSVRSPAAFFFHSNKLLKY